MTTSGGITIFSEVNCNVLSFVLVHFPFYQWGALQDCVCTPAPTIFKWNFWWERNNFTSINKLPGLKVHNAVVLARNDILTCPRPYAYRPQVADIGRHA